VTAQYLVNHVACAF